jgi:hypothetical protein
MKRLVCVLIAIVAVTFSVPCFANTASKFKGGVKEVMLSPLQVSENVKAETTFAKFLPFAFVGGFLKGTFYMVKHIVTGTLNVVTSPF